MSAKASQITDVSTVCSAVCAQIKESIKYLEFFSPSSNHLVRHLTIAPCVLSFNIILRSCFKTSIFSIIVSKSALGLLHISSCKFWSLVSKSLISALILLFLLLANLIVWPLMTHLIVSHKREGLASLLVSFTPSIICLTSLTYSKSYKRLQLIFQYPGPLSFSYAIKESPMEEWSESTKANETRNKVPTAENFSWFFFLYQVKVWSSGCCNLQMSTKSVCSH